MAWCRSAPPGESPTLSHDEHKRVVELCVEEAGGRVPVIAGAGSNNTAEAIDLARHAEAAKADAVLIVTPYYNKPTQEGPLPALQGDQRCHRHPDLHLQHSRTLGGRHVGRDDEAAVRAEEHRRRQGRDREPCPRQPAAPASRARLHPAVRRGRDRARLQRPWRRGLHLRDVECRAAALLGVPGGLPRGRLRQGPDAPGPADAAAHRALHRDEPDAGEVCACRCSGECRPRRACPWFRSPSRRASPSKRRWSMPG